MDEKPRRKSSRSRLQISTRSSENEVVAQRKKHRDKNTSAALRSFRTHLESVPEALQGTRPIPLADLASKLGVDAKRLLPLLEHGYLKIVTPDPPVVQEPPPGAMDWLRVMFQPLSLRPFLSSKMVGDLEGLGAPIVRRLCLEYNIPIYSDPVFGELMSISAFYRFHQQMHSRRYPSRFDRQGMLWALMHLVHGKEWTRDVKVPKYSRRLELEIRRISGLKEPARTDAALRLWEAWSDTQKVVDSIAAAQGKEVPKFKAIKRLKRILEVDIAIPQTEVAADSSAEPSPSDPLETEQSEPS